MVCSIGEFCSGVRAGRAAGLQRNALAEATVQGYMRPRQKEIDDEQFTLISKALADPKRFEMLQKIGASSDAPTCSDLGACVELAPATVSHHLKELDAAGLIKIERDGKYAHLTLRRDVWKAYLKRLSSL
jgi:ArsR family transcriptional regulator, arsenate/arsenite/antimonite-responsive transcriptional repressor